MLGTSGPRIDDATAAGTVRMRIRAAARPARDVMRRSPFDEWCSRASAGRARGASGPTRHRGEGRPCRSGATPFGVEVKRDDNLVMRSLWAPTPGAPWLRGRRAGTRFTRFVGLLAGTRRRRRERLGLRINAG